MMIGKRCDLRQMRHTKHLVRPRERFQLLANRFRRSSAYAGVNFIEDQRPLNSARFAPRIARLHASLQRQHHAREFSPRGNLLEWMHGLAGVRRNHKFRLIEAGVSPVALLVRAADFDAKLRLHGQFIDFGFHKFLKLFRHLVAFLRNSASGLQILLRCLGEFRAQFLQDLVFILNFRKLARDFFAQFDDVSKRGPVFAFQAVEQCQPVFDFRKMLGRSFNASGIVAQAGADVFHADACGVESRQRLLKLGFVAGKLFDLLLRGAQRGRSRAVAFVEQIEGVHGGVVNLLGIG